MKRLVILAAIVALSASPAFSQFRPPPIGMDEFKLITARNGETWWRREVTEPGNRWVHFAKPVDGSWFDPPLAVISRAEYAAASQSGLLDVGPIDAATGAVLDFGMKLEHKPESPGFSTNDKAGALILNHVGQEPHVHTADCDDGRCPNPDTPDSPDGNDSELLGRRGEIDWLLYVGIGACALGVLLFAFAAVGGFVLVIYVIATRRDG